MSDTTDKIHDPYNPTRTVTLWPSPDWLDNANEVTRGDVFRAIGYLSYWAAHRYPQVAIHDADGVDLTAVFTDPASGSKYVIGAIWREAERKYSFHS